MITASGTVERVDVDLHGSHLAVDAAVNATVLTLESATRFDPAGGQLMLPQVDDPVTGLAQDMTAAYVSADPVAGTVTLVDPLPQALEAGFPVWAMLGDDIAQTRWATVDLDDPDAEPVFAKVRSTKGGFLPAGEYPTPLSVDLSLEKGIWYANDPRDVPVSFDAQVRVSDEDGGVAGGVDTLGNVTAADLSYQGAFRGSAATMLIDDQTLLEKLAGPTLGIMWRATRDADVTGIATEYGVIQAAFYLAVDRSVRVSLKANLTGSATGTKALLRVRHTFSATAPPAEATAAAPLSFAEDEGKDIGTGVNTVHSEETLDLAAGYYNFRVSLLSATSGQTVSFNRGVLEFHDAGPSLGGDNVYAKPSTSVGTLGGGGADSGTSVTPTKQTYTISYPATDTNWWEGDNTYRVSDNQYVGYLAGEGNRKSAMWFDSAKIAADLSGATVLSARLKMTVWEGGNDKTVLVGSHSDATVRTSYTAITGKNMPTNGRASKSSVNEGTTIWVTLGFDLQGWVTGATRGLLVGPGASNAGTYKFSYRGDAHANRPVLELTFER